MWRNPGKELHALKEVVLAGEISEPFGVFQKYRHGILSKPCVRVRKRSKRVKREIWVCVHGRNPETDVSFRERD